jgi:lipoprotein NlpI/transglutaminase-like putative cysteine protease
MAAGKGLDGGQSANQTRLPPWAGEGERQGMVGSGGTWWGAVWLWLLLSCGLAPAAAQPVPGDEASPAREVQLAAGAFTRGQPVPAWVQPQALPPLRGDEPVLIRLIDTQLRLGSEPSMYVDTAVQVKRADDLAVIGQYSLSFVPDYQRFHLHRVQLLRGAQVLDKTREVSVRFLQREAGLERGAYSGAVTVSLLVPDARAGDTLRVAYRVDGHNPVFDGRFHAQLNWDVPLPVQRRHTSVLHPVARPLHWRMLGDAGRLLQPQVQLRGREQRLEWDERDLPALEPEPLVPDAFYEARVLQLSEFADWQDVARWATTLFPPAAALPQELRELVARIAALPTPAERAAEALRWVQREIRYFSVAIGESSHRPSAPAQVLARRYGDCKDKTYLLLTLLRALQVPAQPVLLSQRLPRAVPRQLPSPLPFDHVAVIVHLDGQRLFLDPTAAPQPVPLAVLSQPAAGRLGLLVDAASAALTPLADPQRPAPEDAADLVLDERLRLPALAPAGSIEATLHMRGARAEAMRQSWPALSEAERQRLVLALYEKRYRELQLLQPPQLQDDPARNRVSLTMQLRTPQLAQPHGTGWVVPFFPHILHQKFNLPESLQRRFPLQVLEAPLALRYTLVVDWPDQVQQNRDPSTRRLQGEVFQVEVRQAFRGARFELQMDFASTALEVSAERAPKVYEDLQALAQLLGGRVNVDAGAIAPPVAEPGAANPAQATVLRQAREQLQRMDRALARGELQGEDLGTVLCLRSAALGDLGRSDEALQDSARAVKLAETVALLWNCRGRALYRAGDFTAADAAFNRAIALDDVDPDPRYRRGINHFFQGRLDEAAADFAAAVARSEDADEQVYFRLWQAFALRRAGRALPAELMQAAREAAQGPWPRPALVLAAGLADGQAMMQAAEQGSPGERALALAEAWFYLGQHHLLQGRTDEARRAFEQCRAQGISSYTEHDAAGHELARMNPQKRR